MSVLAGAWRALGGAVREGVNALWGEEGVRLRDSAPVLPIPLGSQQPACDVVILVATDSEQQALEEESTTLGIAFERKQTDILGEYFDLGVVGTDRVLAVRTRMGAIRHEGSAYKAIVFRRATQATAIIQTGMAFGVYPTAQNHGDVLVASSILPYDERDVRERDGQRLIDYTRAKRRAAKAALVKLFEREVARGGHPFGVHVGALLSGSARIFSEAFRDELVREVPSGKDRIIGGEMEGVGLLSASPADRPLWAIVKGISDFADSGRDAIIEDTRHVACRNAARFVLTALRNNPG